MFHRKSLWIALAILLVIALIPITITFCNHQKERIFIAASHGDIPRLQALIRSNPRIVFQRDKVGKTPLHYAAKANQISAINFLLNHGAPIDATDRQHATPLIDATLHSNVDAVRVLVQRGANLKIVEYIQNPNILSSNQAAIHIAAHTGNLKILKILISKDKSILHEKSKNTEPLAYALDATNSLDVMQLMIDSGADVNAQNKYSRSPLYFAVFCHNIDCVQLLLEKGANVNARTKLNFKNITKGITPLHLAAGGGQWSIARILLSYGANPYLKDAEGKTPIDYARSSGDRTMLNILQHPIVSSISRQKPSKIHVIDGVPSAKGTKS